ncbi:hypothetical protein B0F90DRAFT_1632849 [Multifurca ochricompacta]|uniref:Lipid droplet-associated hydrolase n=1 Tax=Multifurca ochricompacta TaxID=376703 RepID=A0AAD4QM95_9AGAM|nr:hypothetical protein B0F90DRAFT_1632849 [Multifurca ochricompacta]
MDGTDSTPLPRFLQPWELRSQSQRAYAPVPVHAVYTHKRPFGQAQVLWWPWRMRDEDGPETDRTRTVLLFIPGNPGLLDFYVPLLNAIHRRVEAASPTSSFVTIFAHAHLGLSSYIGGDQSYPEIPSVSLPAQIQAHVEFLDELLAEYGPETRVLLVGHSIGSWFIQEVLKARVGLRPPRVGVFMLFPTISHIGGTPNGRKLSPIFRPPWPRVLSRLSLLARHLPLCILSLVQPTWPKNQLKVLSDFLRAPAAIYSALTMANDEMKTVRDLDVDFLRDFAESMWIFYAEKDDWVGEQREVVLCALRGMSPEGQVVHGYGGIPHAFCISEVSL